MKRLFSFFALLALAAQSLQPALASSFSPIPAAGGGGTVTTVGVTTANGVSGTVANPTTTPAISVTLGAITPSSVAASGSVTGSNLSGTNTGDQTTVSGQAGSVANAVTFDNSGSGAATGTTFNGSAARTISTNTIGALKASNNLSDVTAATARTNLGLATIAASGSGADLTASTVTYAKIQNVAASSLLGNPTGGSTAVSEITLGSSFTFSGSTLYGSVSHPGYVAGNWYSPIPGTAITAGSAPASGSIRLLPFTISKPISIAQLGARVTTLSAAGNFQLAIYANSASAAHATGTALCTTGNMSTGSTGTVTAVATCTGTLNPGTYWEAVNQDNSVAVYASIAPGSTTPGYLVGSTAIGDLTANSTTSNGTMVVAQAFGTWPDLTSATFASNVASNASALVFMKAQ